MAETKKEQLEQAVVLDDSQKVIQRAKGFWEKYSKFIIYIGAGIILLGGGYMVYKNLIAAPKEEKANEAIWRAQDYFEKDSIQLALMGDGQSQGFEKIAKNFSGTAAGNLAKYYTGICYLKLDQAAKAVTYLKDFNSSSKHTQALAYRALADAYGETNKNEEAIDYYEKAANYFPEDESLSSESLFRAGLKSEILGKNDKAINYYKEIKEKYPKSDRGNRIDEFLARLGVIN